MSTATSIRIPVRDPDNNIIERVDASRARRILMSRNATAIRHRKGQLLGINLRSMSDDWVEPLHANPRSYSHKNETESNPPNVWTLKRIPDETAAIFDNVLRELQAA